MRGWSGIGRVAGLALGFWVAADAQGPVPAFEVATVKASPPRTGTAGFVAMDTDPAMVRYSNVTLKLLIARAYRVDSRLIAGGPAWTDSDLYDVVAKLPAGASKESVPVMLQSLLAERFKLAVHREKKEQRVYFLVVGKNGPKLKKAAEALAEKSDVEQVRGSKPAAQIMHGGIMGHSMDMAGLAGLLGHVAGYEVVDRTALAGNFDINLKWAPDESKGNGPDLFTAVQEQLGLKLEPGKAPVEMLVIDRAERVVAEN